MYFIFRLCIDWLWFTAQSRLIGLGIQKFVYCHNNNDDDDDDDDNNNKRMEISDWLIKRTCQANFT